MVQELAAASFAGRRRAAERAAAQGDAELAGRLAEAAAAVRDGVGGLRSLLVDIYPPASPPPGWPAALRDLAAARGPAATPTIRLQVDDGSRGRPATPSSSEAVFRVAQEMLRNAVAARRRRQRRLELTLAPEGGVRLEVDDDGTGFDPTGPTQAAAAATSACG